MGDLRMCRGSQHTLGALHPMPTTVFLPVAWQPLALYCWCSGCRGEVISPILEALLDLADGILWLSPDLTKCRAWP